VRGRVGLHRIGARLGQLIQGDTMLQRKAGASPTELSPAATNGFSEIWEAYRKDVKDVGIATATGRGVPR
jgi:hypothetical protein